MIYLLYFFQIVLESVPVSSSGHMFLLLHFLGATTDQIHEGLWPALEESAHMVTVAILCIYFFNDMWKLYMSGRVYRVLYTYIPPIIIANGITTLLYVFFAKFHIRDVMPLSLGFSITMLILASSYLLHAKTQDSTMTWRSSCIIGGVQGLALMPGVSRLASTYMVARALGYSHTVAFRFTAALQVPLFLAGAGKGIMTLLYHNQLYLLYDVRLWAVIGIASCISYGLLWCTETIFAANRAWIFAIYLIIPLCLVLIS